MNKNEIEQFFGIIIPNLSCNITGKTIKYANLESSLIEKTSVDQWFNFNNFPLISLDDNETNDFDFYSMPIMKERRILPFASDAGGYFLCFDYRHTSKNPPVILWIRDNSEDKDIAIVADSFEEFINSLKSEDELNH
jgi:hypothetical protein